MNCAESKSNSHQFVTKTPLDPAWIHAHTVARAGVVIAIDRVEILADGSRARPPLARTLLHVTMENLAVLIDAQSDGVACAPFIERGSVKETDERVPRAFLDH